MPHCVTIEALASIMPLLRTNPHELLSAIGGFRINPGPSGHYGSIWVNKEARSVGISESINALAGI